MTVRVTYEVISPYVLTVYADTKAEGVRAIRDHIEALILDGTLARGRENYHKDPDVYGSDEVPENGVVEWL